MSAPFGGNHLEDQLARLRALLVVVAHALEDRSGRAGEGPIGDNEDLQDGAEICLEQALDVLDRIQVGLPAEVLYTEIVDQGGVQ